MESTDYDEEGEMDGGSDTNMNLAEEGEGRHRRHYVTRYRTYCRYRYHYMNLVFCRRQICRWALAEDKNKENELEGENCTSGRRIRCYRRRHRYRLCTQYLRAYRTFYTY